MRSAARAAFLLGLVVVGVLSLAPAEVLPGIEVSDKLQHLLAYAALAYCGGLGWTDRRARLRLLALLIAAGAGIEAAQGLVPGRMPSPADAMANAAGALLGLALAASTRALARLRA